MLVFPAAALLNSFSVTALLLVFGLGGATELAADVGIVQGATLALFYAFSANARNLVLSDAADSMAASILRTRLILVVPLSLAAYILSVGIGGATASLALVLILRRVAEWVGEISLAQHERHGQTQYALRSIVAEITSFALCAALPLSANVDAALAAIPWALVPLLAYKNAGLTTRLRHSTLGWRSLLPHFGSTAIIGTSAYVFRISIALLVGRSLAGELFTAFALGGIVPTIYGQALAPTLARRYGATGLPRKLLVVPALMLLLAGVVIAATIGWPAWMAATARSMTFWLAVGFSIAGGAIMVVATSLRTSLIQRADGRVVFGPDLLANALIATCVPFVYYVLGPRSLAGLYALSACLSLLFLFGAGRQWGWFARHRTPTMSVLGFLLVLPVFFQLSGGLFRDPAFVFETGGAISRVPFPVSVVALFAGIAILGNYAAATRTLTVLFFSALLFVLTALTVAHGNSAQEGAKLILLAQYLLPMFALVLGEMYGKSASKPVFERSALVVLTLIVPAHLVSTWAQGYLLLAPSLYVFSIYQHLQYFPAVMVSVGLMAAFSLSGRQEWQYKTLLMLLPALAVHTVASRSLVAMAGLTIGLLVFAFAQFRARRLERSAIAALAIALVAGVTYGYVARSELASKYLNAAGSEQMGAAPLRRDAAPLSVTDRVEHWRFYSAGVVESPSAFLLGHASPPDRSKHPSAHNYWLDGLYNFGVLALVPIMALMFMTARMIWARRSELLCTPILLGTVVAAVYLLLIENMLKVGLRQPYPGIVGFFIWGLLLARLSALEELAPKPADEIS
ncbi:MAG: hypothetical protein AABM64_00350 [Pseudomonadota bacterium]